MKSLLLNEEEPIYGKYGMLRKQFLKEHRSAGYQYLLLIGKLTEHLNQIDQEARKQVEILMEQMVKKQGATEELKAQDQMEFNRRVEDRVKQYILSRSKLTSEEYDSKLRVEWYMFSDEAKEKGFVDYIIGKDCDIDEII